MKTRYYIDPETDQPHIYNHDVSEDEVEQILSRPGEDRPGEDGSRIALGSTLGGRYLRVIYVPDPEPDSVFVVTAYDLKRKAAPGLPTPNEAETSMKKPKFPDGWDESRVQQLLAHYEGQSEEEAVAEDEATLADPNQTVMEVPSKLVPAVRELIAKST